MTLLVGKKPAPTRRAIGAGGSDTVANVPEKIGFSRPPCWSSRSDPVGLGVTGRQQPKHTGDTCGIRAVMMCKTPVSNAVMLQMRNKGVKLILQLIGSRRFLQITVKGHWPAFWNARMYSRFIYEQRDPVCRPMAFLRLTAGLHSLASCRIVQAWKKSENASKARDRGAAIWKEIAGRSVKQETAARQWARWPLDKQAATEWSKQGKQASKGGGGFLKPLSRVVINLEVSMPSPHELKALQTIAKKLAAEVTVLGDECRRQQRELNMKQSELREINAKIESFAEKEVVVSEHALLRYIERVFKVDLDEIRDVILTEKTKQMIKFSKGNCTVKMDGIELIVKNNVVTSVI